MVRPTQDAIETFMRITGASDSLAVRKLEEYGGNLDQAVNAHFIELEANARNQLSAASPQNNFADTRNQMQSGQRGILPFVSAARSFRPSLLLDPNYRRNLYSQIGASVFPTSRGPQFSPNGEINNDHGQLYHSGPGHGVGGVSGTSSTHGSQIHGRSTRDAESHHYGDDVEEEMIQLAIEASTQERQLHEEDDEFARALELSLKTAEQEKAMRDQTLEDRKLQGVHGSSRRAEKTNHKSKPESSTLKAGAKRGQEQQLWGCISSKEFDEAMQLEEALFGEIPEETLSRRPLRQQGVPDKSKGLNQQLPLPSPSHVAQQLLNQQNDEYLASLWADGEKDVDVLKGAETSCSKEGESQNKMLEGEEFERLLAAKEASLKQEPAPDDKNAVTLLVRMPDGNRHGRRFLKSDKLQLLFDFIDVGRAVKPGTYRVVRPYPRRAFSVSDISLSLNELGLTNKQEALFLELI
ncbi:plant UBX domain-containing protein 9 isoform X3 [Populus nigra]|uniref:plant UBX domain-containing protein 9 isoform X3 n=1 Tax=Populus nigra TaxID=3691 RepID=UPI002B277527|nr:plant UBX domain-containing protein 9 isoform X3 [Populus nigra]